MKELGQSPIEPRITDNSVEKNSVTRFCAISKDIYIFRTTDRCL